MFFRSCARAAASAGIDRPRRLRVLAHLLGQRLQELVERRPQLLHQLLELFVARPALQRLTQRILRLPQPRLGVGHVAVLDLRRHRPQALHHLAYRVVVLRLGRDSRRSSADRERSMPRG